MLNFLKFLENNAISNSLLAITLISLVLITLKNIVRWYMVRRKLPPGPIGVLIFGYLPFLGSEPHKTLNDLSKKYGDIIGLYLGTKYTVILNEYSVMKEVYSQSAINDKALEQFTHVTDFGFGSINGKPWQEQRKFCMSTMKDLGVGKQYFEEVIKEEVDDFLDYLKGLEGKATDISKALQCSIASNLLAFLIGRKLDKVNDADVIQLSNDFSRVVFEISGTTMAVANVPGLAKLYQFLGISGFSSAADIIGKFNSFMLNEIKKHRETSKSLQTHDFVGVYLEEMNVQGNSASVKYFSEQMLLGNIAVLFSGGSDTTFASLIWLLILMTDHKDVQDKAYTEIMKVLGPNGKAKYEERDLIPYTYAVLMEAQRCSGLVTLPGSRVAIDDVQVKGFTIPKGSKITANLWAIHNDPNYYQEPEKFMPERFLSDNCTKLLKNPPSFVPFSVGRRNCPGSVIAWMELLTYFTEIIRNFEVSTAPGAKTDYSTSKGLVASLIPQKICFKHRNSKV